MHSSTSMQTSAMATPNHGQLPLLVWGGGSGGTAAALQAARSGVETLLLTPGPWLGGMVSAAGVCAPDGNELSPWQTGLWGALLRALAKAEPTGLDHNWVSCFGFRPATAEAVLRQWVQGEPRLRWLPNCRLLAVERDGALITAVTVETSLDQRWRLLPDLVIDGSDLGDLLGLGGGDFRLGWESQEQWKEPSAPTAAQLQSDPFFQRQPVQSPTWVAMAQLQPERFKAPGPAGLTRSTGPLPAPFTGATDRFGLERTLSYGRLPGDLVMLNWPLHGNDWHQGLDTLLVGSAQQQASQLEILAASMQEHSLAFARALEEASAGALTPAQVFPTPGQGDALLGASPLALMPYWREGRRLLGLVTVVETDLLPQGSGNGGDSGSGGATRAPLPMAPDGRCTAIAVGNYANDHHYPGGDWPLAPKSCRWGGRWSGTPFCIPYGALVSQSTGNLLAADKCISVSHMANGATRLQPLVINLGQAAGLAAALCLQRGCRPAELPVEALQRALIQEPTAPAGPFPLWDTPWHHPQWQQRQLTALQEPGSIDPAGSLADQPASLDPHQAPGQPHEQLFEGLLRRTGQGGYELAGAGACWPLITLEPALHRHLAECRPGQVALIGCANPWGPWLRVSRLA